MPVWKVYLKQLKQYWDTVFCWNVTTQMNWHVCSQCRLREGMQLLHPRTGRAGSFQRAYCTRSLPCLQVLACYHWHSSPTYENHSTIIPRNVGGWLSVTVCHFKNAGLVSAQAQQAHFTKLTETFQAL